MARVTVEDCLKNVKNRFELVIIAAKRARQLMRGKEPKVEWDNDKSTVVALREIAAGYTDFDTPDREQIDRDQLDIEHFMSTEKPAEKIAEKTEEKPEEMLAEKSEEKIVDQPAENMTPPDVSDEEKAG